MSIDRDVAVFLGRPDVLLHLKPEVVDQAEDLQRLAQKFDVWLGVDVNQVLAELVPGGRNHRSSSRSQGQGPMSRPPGT
jgi:hypothetical protein